MVIAVQGLAPGQLHPQVLDPGVLPLLLGDLLQLLLVFTHLLEDLRPSVALSPVLIVASLKTSLISFIHYKPIGSHLH